MVPRPKSRKIVSTKWIYKTKYKADSSLDKHKARLVARGFTQRPGVDFDETYAPTARMTTIRTLFSLAAHHQWPLYQMDVKSAFLNGVLDNEVYVEQPPGFTVPDKEDWVYRLQKALYGLKQAGRQWYITLDQFLVKLGLRRTHSDANCYVLSDGSLVAIILVYVDDLIFTGSWTSRIEAMMRAMETQFEMTDLGLLHYFLGFEIYQTPRGIFFSQQKYTRSILERFQMTSCRPIGTPLEPAENVSLHDPSPQIDLDRYRNVVGCLVWLSYSRPDICYAVSILSSFSTKPRQQHWNCAMRTLRYIRGTFDHGVFYRHSSGCTLFGWCDSDWAGNPDTRRSTTGVVFTLGSGPISWSSKRQPTVALSSTEAEYRAACFAACEAIWLRRLLGELSFPQAATTLLCDNQSCIAIAKNPIFHARTKHIEVQYHYVRERVLAGELLLQYVPTAENAADILTKAVPQQTLVSHLRLLHVVSASGAERGC